ncbi:hypothetical protein GCM10012275_56440 [Longimycelium tulufanense]|uniref:Uncharacterized protein n=1 Tax=Longimycelium tulufanense TaxID=907463 RepID=A0A8J3CDJ7_9PSEU|nr:hypothetical protein GCM10012275_56440 [Longimycelium tulufanense]
MPWNQSRLDAETVSTRLGLPGSPTWPDEATELRIDRRAAMPAADRAAPQGALRSPMPSTPRTATRVWAVVLRARSVVARQKSRVVRVCSRRIVQVAGRVLLSSRCC